MMTESDLHKMVTLRIVGRVTRFENLISSGVFDANLFYSGLEMWVEYKIEHAGRIEVRGPQYVWGRTRLTQGMDNLYFLVASHELKIKLFTAEIILERCNLSVTNKQGAMVVNIKDLTPINTVLEGELAWTGINKEFFGC